MNRLFLQPRDYGDARRAPARNRAPRPPGAYHGGVATLAAGAGALVLPHLS